MSLSSSSRALLPSPMNSLWKTRWVLFSVLAYNMMHRVDAQMLESEECTNGDCCKTSSSEMWRGFSCSMYAYLDDDPVLQMEGCAKHGEGCKVICGESHKDLTDKYKDCDAKYDKDTVYADWQNCFFTHLFAGLVKAATNSDKESIPPENVTHKFCDLLSQPGCPLCIKMRWGAPCSNPQIKDMCPIQCKSCFCSDPNPADFQATSLTCQKSTTLEDGTPISAFADTCSLTCPADTSSATRVRCEHGVWKGINGDARCMKNCENTGITLPAGGTELTRTGLRTNDCSSLKHLEKCKLSCGSGTAPSAYWQCYNGEIVSTRPPYEPQCLNNCVAPPVPENAEEFGDCSNEVLEDPDANFEAQWSAAAAYAGLTGKAFTLDFTGGVDTSSGSASPLRDQLQSGGTLDDVAATCKVLKEENTNDPVNEKFSWRRLKPDDDDRVLARRLEDADDSIYVPPHTPHGSTCTLKCKHPYAADQQYSCWDGTWTVPKCTVQLFNQGIQWPNTKGSVVSYLGSLYADYNLDVIMPNRSELKVGSKVSVCAGDGLGCPTGQCFAEVPVEDGGRITTKGSQLRVRLGYDIEEAQHYGCEYEVTIPESTVVAVLDRSVGNPEMKWTYRLDPPPPRLMKKEVDIGFSSAFVQVKYNGLGTIKCLVKPQGQIPVQEDFDFQVQFWTQVSEDAFASGTLLNLEEKTDYSLYCQATGISGLTQSLVDVIDNEKKFTTKSKIPYAYSIEVSQLGNTEIQVQMLYSTECVVRCAASQREDGDFTSDTHKAALKEAAEKAPPKVFVKDPISYTLSGLIPNLPTQILCRAVSEDKNAEKNEQRFYSQLDSDSWAYAIEVTTPAMINTELGSLTAEGCTLVPSFAPDRAVYACAIDPGRGADVKLAATVAEGMYSHLECEDNWAKSCEGSFAASSSSTWQFNVRAQSGAKALYVIVMMTDPPVVPKKIVPQTLAAITEMQNVTVCAAANSDILPKITMDNVKVQLLPGPWDLEIAKLKTGSGLPTCQCTGCNVELNVYGQGAGSNLTFVLFVEGVPTFSLDTKMQIHFSPPEVTDVNPPEPSVYKSTELTVYGHNFGGTNMTGAVITVKKVGPPIGLPAATWFAGCPLLSIEVSKKSVTGSDTTWVHHEFSGRYQLTDREEYTMIGDRKVFLEDDDLQAIDDVYPDTRKDCTPRCPSPKELSRVVPNKINDKLIYEVGICCFKESMDLIGFEGNLVHVRIGSEHKYAQIRTMPTMRVMGNVWQINSNLIGSLRIHSEARNLRQKKGWMVKHQGTKPPGPGEEMEENAWGGRRLSESELSALTTAFRNLKEAFPKLEHTSHARPRSLWDSPPGGKNWTKNAKGNWICEEGEDQDEAVTNLLESMGYANMVPEEDHNCELFKNGCGMASLICQCTCADYDPTPVMEELEEVTVNCERCGDGVRVGWEQCDDGNQRDDDGCSRKCEIEDGWTCSLGEGCKRKPGASAVANEDEAVNLCGPTVWVDDSTLKCELMGTSNYPIALSIDLRGQGSEPSQDWIQYVKPAIRTMLVSVLEIIAGSNKEFSNVLEFKGGQKIILNGRSLPPTPEEGQKHQLTMLIGETILCAGVDVKSSSSFECPISQPLDLGRVTLDPEVVIRVGEVSSEGVKLSRLGLILRQPSLDIMSPIVFNDTELKDMNLTGTHLGSLEFGKLTLTVGGSPCIANSHSSTLIECELGYVPVGSWLVEMTLGNIPAISKANVTVVPTYCHPGMHRVELETAECVVCETGTAEPAKTADFSCPNCTNSMYQNDTGQLSCKHCVDNTFSVPNRSSKEHCRCYAGFYHAYGNPSLAEQCTKCEYSRGFGWSTTNWTVDCEDCAEQQAEPPEDFFYYGNCSEECYGYECSPCPPGAVCFGNAAWPRVLPGFWSINVFERNANNIERCMPMEACLGDDGYGEMVCNTGYEGIRCGVCKLGFYKDQHICYKCPNNQWIFAVIFAAFFFCILVIGIIPAMILFMKRMLGIHSQLPLIWRCWFKCCCCCACCFKKSEAPKDTEEVPPTCCDYVCAQCCWPMIGGPKWVKWDAELRQAPLLRTLSMCLNFGHTCYAFAMLQRPAVAWPDPSWELLSWTKLLTVDVEFMKPDCVVPMPFFTKWIGKFFMPFGMFALLVLVTCYVQRSLSQAVVDATQRGRATVWSTFRFTAALIIHVVLIWHLKVALSPVDCNWCREGVTCLDEYTLVECWGDDETWIKMMVISITDFIFVSGFFPIFLSITIWRAWRASARLDPTREQESGQVSFVSFFVTGYKDRFTGGTLFTFGWEVVVLFRKLALIVSAKFTSTDPVRGANLQLLILLLSLVMQLTMRPYKANILCNIDNFLCVLLFLSLLSACQLTMGGLGGMEGAYIALNVIALFGGAICAILVCLRKLMHAYQAETRAREEAQGHSKVIAITPVEGGGDLKVTDVEDAPAEDVRANDADEQDSETAI